MLFNEFRCRNHANPTDIRVNFSIFWTKSRKVFSSEARIRDSCKLSKIYIPIKVLFRGPAFSFFSVRPIEIKRGKNKGQKNEIYAVMSVELSPWGRISSLRYSELPWTLPTYRHIFITGYKDKVKSLKRYFWQVANGDEFKYFTIPYPCRSSS